MPSFFLASFDHIFPACEAPKVGSMAGSGCYRSFLKQVVFARSFVAACFVNTLDVAHLR